MIDTKSYPPMVGGSNAIYGQDFTFGEVTITLKDRDGVSGDLSDTVARITAKTNKDGPVAFTKTIPLEYVGMTAVISAWSMTAEDWSDIQNPVSITSQNLIVFVELIRESGLPIPLFQYTVNIYRNHII